MRTKEKDYTIPYSIVVSNDFNNDSKMVLLLIYNSKDYKLSQITIREKLNMSKFWLEKALRVIQSMWYVVIDDYWQIIKTEYGNEMFWFKAESKMKSTKLETLRKKKLIIEKKYWKK